MFENKRSVELKMAVSIVAAAGIPCVLMSLNNVATGADELARTAFPTLSISEIFNSAYTAITISITIINNLKMIFFY